MPPFLIHYLPELLGMLLEATDMALWVRIVEPLLLVTDVVIVYFLIVIVRLIVVWVGI